MENKALKQIVSTKIYLQQNLEPISAHMQVI